MKIEHVVADPDVDGSEGLIATIIRSTQDSRPGVHFATGLDSQLQVGVLKHKGGMVVPAHKHIHHDRKVTATEEVLVIEAGSVVVDLYRSDGAKEATVTLTKGDIIILHSGGHGLRFTEDSIVIEVKQGPYMGQYDKIRL